MEIIAKTNNQGVLIQASEEEVKEILNAVIGKRPDKIEIGQKIPAIDYATTITKIKSLSNNQKFKYLLEYNDEFQKQLNELKSAIESASKIDL